MNKEELLEFKKKNITDEVIMNLEASLHLSMKIVDDEDKKQEFKEYQMAVYFLREQRDNLKQELQEIKKYIGKEWYCYDNESEEFKVAKDILDKINELEGDSK